MREIGPQIICTHKGISSIVGSTPELADPSDIGPAAKRNPDVNFVVYHSGSSPAAAASVRTTRTTPRRRASTASSVRSSRPASSRTATCTRSSAAPGGTSCAIPTAAAHVLGKLLEVRRRASGCSGAPTRSGSARRRIRSRRCARSRSPRRCRKRHGYPKLTPAIKAGIFGLNAAALYDIEPIAGRCELTPTEIEKIRATLPPATHIRARDRGRRRAHDRRAPSRLHAVGSTFRSMAHRDRAAGHRESAARSAIAPARRRSCAPVADAARRRRPRRVHAAGGGRRAAVHARRGVAHAPAQRSHLRSQRRRHDAVGDEPGRRSRCGSSARRERSEVVDGMRAMLRPDVEYRIAHHDDLDVGAAARGASRSSRASCSTRTACASSPRRPITGPVEPTLGFRIEHDGQAVVLAGDTVPCAGLDELCRGADVYVQTVLRDDLVQPGADAALPRHDRLPLDGRAGRADRGARRACTRSC